MRHASSAIHNEKRPRVSTGVLRRWNEQRSDRFEEKRLRSLDRQFDRVAAGGRVRHGHDGHFVHAVGLHTEGCELVRNTERFAQAQNEIVEAVEPTGNAEIGSRSAMRSSIAGRLKRSTGGMTTAFRGAMVRMIDRADRVAERMDRAEALLEGPRPWRPPTSCGCGLRYPCRPHRRAADIPSPAACPPAQCPGSSDGRRARNRLPGNAQTHPCPCRR